MGESKRKVRKFTVGINEKVCVEYGWMDRNSTDVLYLYIKCWILPRNEFDYSRQLKRVISNTCDDLQKYVRKDGTYYDRFIFDSFYNVENVTPGGKRFLSIEAFLRRRSDDNTEVDIECYEDKIKALVGDFCDKYVERLESVGFDVRREKNA